MEEYVSIKWKNDGSTHKNSMSVSGTICGRNHKVQVMSVLIVYQTIRFIKNIEKNIK